MSSERHEFTLRDKTNSSQEMILYTKQVRVMYTCIEQCTAECATKYCLCVMTNDIFFAKLFKFHFFKFF